MGFSHEENGVFAHSTEHDSLGPEDLGTNDGVALCRLRLRGFRLTRRPRDDVQTPRRPHVAL